MTREKELECVISDLSAECREQRDEITALKAQLAECKKDAQRYQFVRNNTNSDEIGIAIFDNDERDWIFTHDGFEIDEAIDAAIAQKEEA
jgi:hypothetical protein